MNRKINIVLILTGWLTIAGFNAYAQAPSFAVQVNVKISGVTTLAQTDTLSLAHQQTAIVYYDGLGRAVQTVAAQASPLQNDIIQPVAYDHLGRQTVSYLPYAGKAADTMGGFRSNAISTAQPAFYDQTSQYLIPVDTAAHARQVFDNSPLQFLLQSGTVGTGYQPGDAAPQHYTTVSYRPNSNALDGNIVITGTTNTVTFTSYYTDGSLWVTDGKDADNEETLVFKNLAGQTILKRQVLASGTFYDTYYIYNNAGSIKYIVPPKATYLLLNNAGYTLSTASVSNLIYSYSYNARGQITSKTAPGSCTVSIIYDPLNRPVLTQDANSALINQWNYIKYDVKGRPAITGTYIDTNPGHITAAQMQTYVSGINYSTNYYESRTIVATNYYYTDNVFPTSGTTPLSYNYYDNYNWKNGTSPDYSYSTQTFPTPGPEGQTIVPSGATTATIKGMPTITMTQTIGPGFSSLWLTKTVFYDIYGRVIQTNSNNHMYSPGTLTDSKTAVLDFTGKPIATKLVVQNSASSTNTIYTTFNYDSRNTRLADVDQAYNSTTNFYHISNYSYNELGQVIAKNLGGRNRALPTGTDIPLGTSNSVSSGQTLTVTATNSITMSPNFAVANGGTFTAQIGGYLQTVNFRYNIRGQLVNINNPTLKDDTGKTSNESTDLFGMQLFYDNPDGNLTGTTPSYTGRTSAVEWMSRDGNNNKTNERSYVYSYDKVNRYTGSVYAERAVGGTGSFNVNNDGFDENGITYDQNGNILSMLRTAATSIGATSHMQVDDLVYNYDGTLPNKLNTVSDGTGTNYTSYGFRNYTGSTASYTYDPEGNLTADPYKALSFTFNQTLNRATAITQTTTGAYVSYTYDASGNVLRKQVWTNSTTLQSTTDYSNGLVYTTTGSTTVLSYFAMPEGRVVNTNGTLAPEYVIIDQQGNARFSFANDGNGGIQIRQENSYYASGESLAVSSVATLPATPNINLYNGGSEWQNEFSNLLDYHQTFFRNYDPAIGRFIASDPMPESAESMTTYQYAGNNAVMGNDPMGNINRLPVAPEMSYGNGVGDNLNDLGPGSYLGGGGGGDYSAEWTQILASYGFNGVIMPSTTMATPASINVAALNSVTASLNDINDGTAIPGGGIYVNITDGIFSSAAVDPYANGQIANNLNLTNEDLNAIATIELGILQNQSSSGGNNNSESSGSWDTINNGLTAFGIGSGVKGSLIDAAMNSGEEVTSALKTYGKVTDALSVAGGLLAMGSSGYNMYNQYEQNQSISDIHIGDAGDFAVGTASVAATLFLATNPIGWVIGAGAAIYFTGRLIYQETHQ